MDKEDEYFCLICQKISKVSELGDEADWGIFSCPRCGSAHCGVEYCCGKQQFVPVEVL